MRIAASVCEQVKELERKIRAHEAAAFRYRTEEKSFAAQAENLWSQMGFRERRLGGWFWGNRKMVSQHRELLQKEAEAGTTARSVEALAEKDEARIFVAIRQSLRTLDPEFSKVADSYDSSRRMKGLIDRFITIVSEAINEVDEAEEMEWFDIASGGNKGVALLSYFETAEAGDSLKEVHAEFQVLREELALYTDVLGKAKTAELERGIGNKADLLLDLSLDGFDFMSFFVLSELEDAEELLDELYSKAQQVNSVLTEQVVKITAVMKAYTDAARSECA